MRLDELARRLGARAVTSETLPPVEVKRIYAGDRVSDILDHVSETTLLVTNLATAQLIRVAELMGLVAVCLVGGQVPEPSVVEAAVRRGTVVLVSPFGLFETCGRLYTCLAQEGGMGV